MRSLLAMGAAVVAAIGIAACSRALPADNDWTGQGCRGTAVSMIIHGSPSDSRVTWVTRDDGTERREITWPIGYTARFGPTLEVLAENGEIVAREGDRISGWCYTVDMPLNIPVRVDRRNVVLVPPAT